jgi:hypothetical protein
MKIRTILALGLVALLVMAVVMPPRADESPDALRMALGDSEYRSCGLHKLDQQERHHLSSIFTGCPSHSYLEESSARFLEKEGWSVIRVIGATPGRDGSNDSDRELIVATGYDLYALQPRMGAPLLEPGEYWMDKVVTSWTILLPDGTTGSYSSRDLSQH